MLADCQVQKGHLLESLHCELLAKAQQLLGADREVTLLGDGEFDGTDLLEKVCSGGWEYVCRTAKNVCLYEGCQPFGFSDLLVPEGGMWRSREWSSLWPVMVR
ncbi:MAG: transposase, family [Chthonomonadaceae bacterium]|nr:transposase, family [Chthonomonadaceae bacterium]